MPSTIHGPFVIVHRLYLHAARYLVLRVCPVRPHCRTYAEAVPTRRLSPRRACPHAEPAPTSSPSPVPSLSPRQARPLRGGCPCAVAVPAPRLSPHSARPRAMAVPTQCPPPRQARPLRGGCSRAEAVLTPSRSTARSPPLAPSLSPRRARPHAEPVPARRLSPHSTRPHAEPLPAWTLPGLRYWRRFSQRASALSVRSAAVFTLSNPLDVLCVRNGHCFQGRGR
jgi:hypothetical protein